MVGCVGGGAPVAGPLCYLIFEKKLNNFHQAGPPRGGGALSVSARGPRRRDIVEQVPRSTFYINARG